MLSSVIESVGHAFMQRLQFTHASASIRTVKAFDLVCQRLHRAEGAKQAALGSALRQQGQEDHQRDEEGDKNDCLHEDLERGNGFELRHRLEGTEPRTVRRAEKCGGGQDDRQQDGPRQVRPPGIDIPDGRFFRIREKASSSPPKKHPQRTNRVRSPAMPRSDDKHAAIDA